MILHHYEISPYSEKIRLMFGYAGLDWQSAISPPAPPRPIVDPLIGGYRRIPVAQIGADIFCDTRIIASEVARIVNKPELSFAGASEAASEFATKTNNEVFMPVVQTANKSSVLKMLATRYWPWQILRLIKDRANVAKTSKSPRLSRSEIHERVATFRNELENKLISSPFLFGDQPDIADFAAYHLVWFADKTRPKPFLSGLPKASAWQARMQKFGQGKRTKVIKAQVFEITKQAEPRELSATLTEHSDIGKEVTIAPNDYALDSVTGTLVGADAERWIIARQTPECGRVHVHFPTTGYDLTTNNS